jgi:hypothetical protein
VQIRYSSWSAYSGVINYVGLKGDGISAKEFGERTVLKCAYDGAMKAIIIVM